LEKFYWLKRSTICLLAFDALKQSFKVSGSKTLGTHALYNFEEQGWADLNGFYEDLQQVPFFIGINQNGEFL